MKKSQGATFLGFVFILGMAAFIARIGLSLAPAYIEYYSVVMAMKAVAQDREITSSEDSENKRSVIQTSLRKRFDISYVRSVKAKDAKMRRTEQGIEVMVQYDVVEHLFGNVDGIVHFEKMVLVPGA